jgi:hypothetical protein
MAKTFSSAAKLSMIQSIGLLHKKLENQRWHSFITLLLKDWQIESPASQWHGALIQRTHQVFVTTSEFSLLLCLMVKPAFGLLTRLYSLSMTVTICQIKDGLSGILKILKHLQQVQLMLLLILQQATC